MSYYSKWGTIIGSPIFQRFLRRNYELGVSDLALFNKSLSFKRSNFTCLLCGVGNKETARTFIQFVTHRNSQAKIIIIDLGEEQIQEVNKLVRQSFSQYQIEIKRMDALNLLSWLEKSSIDWIETDGFLEFFSDSKLAQLLSIWYSLLKKDGFITLREPASNSGFGSLIDSFRIKIAMWWLSIQIYLHTMQSLNKQFDSAGFQYATFPTIVPTFRRYTLIKKQ